MQAAFACLRRRCHVLSRPINYKKSASPKTEAFLNARAKRVSVQNSIFVSMDFREETKTNVEYVHTFYWTTKQNDNQAVCLFTAVYSTKAKKEATKKTMNDPPFGCGSNNNNDNSSVFFECFSQKPSSAITDTQTFPQHLTDVDDLPVAASRRSKRADRQS